MEGRKKFEEVRGQIVHLHVVHSYPSFEVRPHGTTRY